MPHSHASDFNVLREDNFGSILLTLPCCKNSVYGAFWCLYCVLLLFRKLNLWCSSATQKIISIKRLCLHSWFIHLPRKGCMSSHCFQYLNFLQNFRYGCQVFNSSHFCVDVNAFFHERNSGAIHNERCEPLKHLCLS